MDQVRDQSARNLLKKYKVDEAVGGFRCALPNYKSWGALIEPLGEHKINSNSYSSRLVTLKTEIMPPSDITSFYFKRKLQKDIEQSRQRELNEKYQAQEKAKQQVEDLGIIVHGVNKMHPEWNRPYGINGKLYANIFLDDRGGFWNAYWRSSFAKG